ncbi:hypothetical protein OEZ85_006978 [Tetradesmus obliquus]|uniref:F-box domain-containing protein n=1 Tax=Tetradesmus obliquus TaxID=3088 RepID=A0ABY8U141_TETOB|nr:hypothetical protein OEZ85_006978 [Tetradesmus obliquus]
MDVEEALDLDEEGVRLWKELPSTVLCHILQQIPYKRADVKGVCSSWRTAINRSLNSISMPAADLPLLRQLPDIKHLTVTGAATRKCMHEPEEQADLQQQQHKQQQEVLPSWPPSSCPARQQAAAGECTSSCIAALPATDAANSEDAQGSCWAAVEPRLLNKLQSLRLLECPIVVQQLADGLLQPLAGSSSSSTWCAPLPALTALQCTGLTKLALQDNELLDQLPAGISQLTALQVLDLSGAASLRSLGPGFASLTCLTELNLSGPSGLQLVVLPGALSALTGLTLLDAGGCGLRWLGDEVLACSSLQQLLLGDNVLVELPDAVSALQAMRVLDVGRCSSLWRLPSSLLRLSLLQRLVVPSKAIAQHVCEQLECRAQPVQVDMEPGDDCSDGDDWDLPPLLDHESDGNESDDLI